MRKSVSILLLMFITLGLSACAKPSASQDEQRSHAKGAQDELSSEVHK